MIRLKNSNDTTGAGVGTGQYCSTTCEVVDFCGDGIVLTMMKNATRMIQPEPVLEPGNTAARPAK